MGNGMRWRGAWPWFIGAVLLLAGCTSSPYAEVHHVSPRLPAPAGTGRLGLVEQFLAKAIHEDRGHPLAAMGDCLIALKDASDELKRSPNDRIALRDYNF